MSLGPGQCQDAVAAQQVVVAAALANYNAALAALVPLKAALKTAMGVAGIQEGDKNDPRPFADRTFPSTP